MHETAQRTAAENGFDGIELWAQHAETKKLDLETIRRLKKELGLNIVVHAKSWDLNYAALNDVVRRASVEEIKSSVDMAVELGADEVIGPSAEIHIKRGRGGQRTGLRKHPGILRIREGAGRGYLHGDHGTHSEGDGDDAGRHVRDCEGFERKADLHDRSGTQPDGGGIFREHPYHGTRLKGSSDKQERHKTSHADPGR